MGERVEEEGFQGHVGLLPGHHHAHCAVGPKVTTDTGRPTWPTDQEEANYLSAVRGAVRDYSQLFAPTDLKWSHVGFYRENKRGWIFTRNTTNGVWAQQGSKLVGSGSVGTNIQQGAAVSLSSDRNILAVGGSWDNSNMGATWIFTRNTTNGVWSQQGSKLVGSGSVGTSIQQGDAVSLSSDGNTLAVGGPYDNSGMGATWIFQSKALIHCFVSDTSSLTIYSVFQNKPITACDEQCAPTASCSYTTSPSTCVCNIGYQGNGTLCTDCNECQGHCGGNDCTNGNATCTNTVATWFSEASMIIMKRTRRIGAEGVFSSFNSTSLQTN